MNDDYFLDHYCNWRKSRLAGLEKYLDTSILKDKTLLELGCGYADIGRYFKDNYKTITTVSDVRVDYLKVVQSRDPELEVMLFDCDNYKLDKKFNFILHWGVLYHIKSIDSHLKNICENCDYLLLETEVMDSSNPNDIVYVHEDGYDQSMYNVGCRPSQAYVERLLEENGFEYKIILDPILNSDPHTYSWDLADTKSCSNGLRRYWIAWKKGVASPLRST